MKIIDENGNEVINPDLSVGYLKDDTIIKHHEAVEGVEEQWHYETIATYPNGGKDVQKVIDVPGVEAQEAWDEKIPALRYVLFTEEELEKANVLRSTPTAQDDTNAMLIDHEFKFLLIELALLESEV